ncbi:MAG: hypothetical protein U0X93_08430 [Anaerolineales bacterium]
MSDLRGAMWAQVQRGVSQLDFDYKGYGQKYFEYSLRPIQAELITPAGFAPYKTSVVE